MAFQKRSIAEAKYFSPPGGYVMPERLLALKHAMVYELYDYTLALLKDDYPELLVKFDNKWNIGLLFYPEGLVVSYGSFYEKKHSEFVLDYSDPDIISKISDLAAKVAKY